MDFDRLCLMFTLQEPYYGILLSAMNREATTIVPTLGVCRSGNVFKLCYNPNYLETLNEEQIMTLLRHEVLHIAFEHFTLWDTPNSQLPDNIREIRNYAEDLEINCYLKKDVIKSLGGLLPEAFGFPEKQGTKEYFKMLNKMMDSLPKPQQQTGSPERECNGGKSSDNEAEPCDGNTTQQQASSGQSQQDKQDNPPAQGANNGGGNSQAQSKEKKQSSLPQQMQNKGSMLDDHSMWPKDENVDKELLKQSVEELLDFAAQEVEKARGEIPGEMKGRIERIRQKRCRPVADWKRYFRRYLGNEFTEFTRKSKKRESRRFPDAAGNRHRRKSHILVAIDTSGSVSMPEYHEFLGQIKTLLPVADFHVLECDARIQHEYEFTGKISDELHGGGGTDFQPPVDYFLERQKLYDCLVYFTDGWAPVPKNTPKDTLWVISSQGVDNLKPFHINGASAVKIKN